MTNEISKVGNVEEGKCYRPIPLSKVGNVEEGKCYRPIPLACRVRFTLVIRTGDLSDLQSQEIITILAILFGK